MPSPRDNLREVGVGGDGISPIQKKEKEVQQEN